MARGGRREGAGRKPGPMSNLKKALGRDVVLQLVPAEPKPDLESPAIDPRVWASMLPEIEEISRRYATNKAREFTPELNPFKLPAFPKGATPPPGQQMAMDSNMLFGGEQWAGGGYLGPAEGLLFLGFTYLAELAQRPEYRVISETIADDATRKWIEFDVTGDEKEQAEQKKKDPKGFDEMMADPDARKKRVQQAGKSDKVKALKDDQLRLEVQSRYYDQARNDGLFGRSHLFHDFGAKSEEELALPVGDGRGAFSRGKIGKGSLKQLKTIEAMWAYPLQYNANNPLADDWYNPQLWYVMGRPIHATRMPVFIGHPVPDILKSAYAFGGLSLTQMAKPYVDIWIQTRQAVAQLIHSFSVMVLMTDLSTLMQPNNAGALLARIAMFNMFRDNNGTFVVNKKTEDFKNVSASLSGLHELQAQSQEHMACLPAGSLVETDRGQVPIEQVTLEDRVMTRGGLAPLCWVGQTGAVTKLVEIRTGDTVLRATEWHPIWSETIREFVTAENVERSDRLLKSTNWANTAPLSFGAADGGGKPKPDISGITKRAGSFIAQSTRRMSALFPRVTTFITSMTTRLTTAFQTSSFSLAPSTLGGTWSRGGLDSIGSRSSTPIFADSAKSRSRRSCQRGRCTVPQSAKAPIGTSVEIEGLSVIDVPLQPVYNLEVAEGFLPEFYANGILVHNSVARIPIVKFTGIHPSGLNASVEEDVKIYYDTIAAYQNRFFKPNLTKTINFEQLSLFGEIDPEITFHFEQLRELTEAEQGQKHKDDADTFQKYVDMGAIAPAEVRKVIIDDPDLPFTALDPEDVPDLQEEEEMGLEPQGGRPDPKAGGEGGAGPSPSKGAGQGGQAHDAKEFDETKHPRAPDGKFGKGSGSSSGGQMGAGEAGSEGEKKQAGEVDKPGREPQMGGNSNGKKRQQSQASALYKPQKHTPEQVEAIANKIVAAFPGGAEAIARTLERLKSVPSTDKPVEEGGFRIYREDGSYDYTPERKAVHEQIVKNIFSDARVAAATPKDGEAPVVTLLGGRGGSGKSWISSKGPLAGKAIEAGGEVPEGMEGGTIVLDADFIKSQLPGYDGWKASKFHEESSDVLDMVDEYARKAGINVTLDATMKSESSIAKRIAAYEEMGYETEGHYMHLPPEEAATRAMARYAKGGKFDGRFVPPEVILGNVNNEQNFDTFSKRFRKWTVYENTGKAPRLVESSHDDE